MKVLAIGSVGFIGSALSIRLLDKGCRVIGIDTHNGYCNPKLRRVGFARHENHTSYTYIRMNLEKFFLTLLRCAKRTVAISTGV